VTITLPHELTEPLGWIGLVWPEADEDKLYADGQTWLNYGSRLRGHAEQANTAARAVWTDNYGDSIEAFEQWWNGEGPGRHLDQAATAVELIGAGLIAMAGVTIVLKTAFIAQLTALAFEVGQAIATAFVTAGATLAEIPVWIALTRTACRLLIHKALEMIEREIAKLFAQAARLLEKAGAKTLAAGAERLSERVGEELGVPRPDATGRARRRAQPGRRRQLLLGNRRRRPAHQGARPSAYRRGELGDAGADARR
jgi:hypothetical protein